MSTYGDTSLLKLVGGAVQPSNTLIDLLHEPAHWLVTLSPLRTQQGKRIVAPVGDVAFVANGTLGHAGREIPFAVDWPTQGGTFAVACSSLRLNAIFEGSSFVTAGNETLDVVFTAWAARQQGPRQTVWCPVRSVLYGPLAATGVPAAIVRLPVPGLARGYTVQAGTSSAAVANGHLEARQYNQVALSPIRSDEWSVDSLSIAPGVRLGLIESTIGASHIAPSRSCALAPAVEWLELENTTAVGLTAVRVVFDLDLG